MSIPNAEPPERALGELSCSRLGRLRATLAVFCVLGVQASQAQNYFNSFQGGCPGAFARKKLITDSLLGRWRSSGDERRVYGATEHFIGARSGTDREKDCDACCISTYSYDATIRFSSIDAFGNIAGRYETSFTQVQVKPDPDYLARHNRVYRIDCGGVAPNAGTVAASVDVVVLVDETGTCRLSGISLTYDGEPEDIYLNMTGPQSFRRSDGRIYRKQ